MTMLTAGPASRYPEFFDWLFRHAFQPRDASDRQQRDILRLDPVPGRHECMSELMEHDARENCQNETNAFQRFCHTVARRVMAQNDKTDQD